MPKSQKTEVIEYLFFKRWDKKTKTLVDRFVRLNEIIDAIEYCNKQYESKLSKSNPANFLKDFLRGTNPSKNWPVSVSENKFTAVQRTHSGLCFEFIPYRPNQTEPFPDEFPIRDDADEYVVQSISMPLATKSLGREDETWAIQTAISLRIVETHFAVFSEFPIIEITHLQTGIKLHKTEIDALFLGKTGERRNPESVLITCEAKQQKDRLIASQIINQVQASFDETEVNIVIPIGIRRIKGVGFYLVEFDSVKRSQAQTLEELRPSRCVIYRLRPPVNGI